MTEASGVAAARLKSFIERIERLEEEKAAIASDIREIYAEAKSSGFDTKIMRQVVKLRKMERQEREEQEQLRDIYMQALGDLAGTPLGEASAPKKPDEIHVTITTGDKRANGTVSVVRAEELPSPDSAAHGATTAKTETRTTSAAPPDRITAALDSVKRQMQAAG